MPIHIITVRVLSNYCSLLGFVILSWLTFAQSTGLQFDERAYNRIPELEKPMGFGDNLPTKYSLKNFTPQVQNQGQFGTCVGWSTTYYAATIEYASKLKMNSLALITANAFDPYYTYLNITGQDNFFSCAGGSLISDAGIFLTKNGVKRFMYNELTCGTKIDVSNNADNVPVKVKGFTRVFNTRYSREENIASVKAMLSEGHPVVIGMALPASFYDIGSDGLFVPKADDSKYIADYGGHAMAVIGYDDERFGGSFEIVNSWGGDWADKGFCYVKYDDFNTFTRMAVVFDVEVNSSGASGDCVFGNCENGYGRFLDAAGNIYEGNFENGQRSGYGFFIWKDDLSFFGGEWLDSKRHGKGTLVNSNGAVRSGYWENDIFVSDQIIVNTKIHGDLFADLRTNIHFLTVAQISMLIRDKLNVENLVKQLDKGCAYGDCKDGLGLFIAENYIYFGMFQSGIRNGYGEMRWTGESWGNAYVGYSHSNTREGIGAYYWPNGNVYIGEWKGGKRHGLGTFFKKDGDTQSGKFQDNNFVSEGLGFGETELDDPLTDPRKVEQILDRPSIMENRTESRSKKKKK